MIGTMSKATTPLALLAATALTLSAAGVAMAANDRDDAGRDRSGFVVACSLDGVNPAFHPEVFANSATARSMGFVQTPDGVWHVLPGCRR